jgi:membrane-bound lytic murein transglycosylase D
MRVVVLSVFTGGCAGGTAVHTGSSGVLEPLSSPIARGGIYTARLAPERAPLPEVRLDEIMASPAWNDPEFETAVGEWIEYWHTDASEAVPVFLARMSIYETTIDSVLAANDLPPSLRYLPFIESGYNPGAASRARAVGLWQFMESTAEGMGMEVTALLDQRRDPIRSTEAAVAFLIELREDLGSWFLALAAYNGGPNRVRRILRQYAPEAEPSDSLFWALRQHFPRETQDFVPKLVGAIIVAGRPEAYGYERVESAERFVFDAVTVPDATTLDVVARAAEVELHEIERLNPQFVRGMTPPNRQSALRVPYGKGAAFETNYALIPVGERVSFVEHRVEEGETLSHIAVRYGVLVADLNDANPGLRPRYLRIGTVLTVPVAPSLRGTSAGS